MVEKEREKGETNLHLPEQLDNRYFLKLKIRSSRRGSEINNSDEDPRRHRVDPWPHAAW